MTRGDKLLVAGIVLIIAVLIIFNGTYLRTDEELKQRTATIAVDGKIVKSITLPNTEKAWRFKVQGVLGVAVVEVSDDKIRMLEAPCPDQICVHRQWIAAPGESIICVPNKMVISIEKNDEGIDATTQ